MGNVTMLKGGGDYGDTYKLINGEVINALGIYKSDAVPLRKRSYMGAEYKATSIAGTPHVKIFYEMSPDLDEDHFVIPSGATNLESDLTDLSGAVIQYTGGEASARVTIADYNGITIRYVGSGPTGEVEITESALNLYVGDSLVKSYDLTVAANDTITEIVALIDALTEWTCSVHANMNGAEKSIHLKIIGRTDCKTGAISLAMDRCIFAEAPNGTPDINFGPAGKMFLRNTANDTIDELVAVIDAFADWTCTKHANMIGTESSKFLKLVVATACKDSAHTSKMELPRVKLITPPPMLYMRLCMVGVSGNAADTVGDLTIFVQ